LSWEDGGEEDILGRQILVSRALVGQCRCQGMVVEEMRSQKRGKRQEAVGETL
jgi:hypothetical protein